MAEASDLVPLVAFIATTCLAYYYLQKKKADESASKPPSVLFEYDYFDINEGLLWEALKIERHRQGRYDWDRILHYLAERGWYLSEQEAKRRWKALLIKASRQGWQSPFYESEATPDVQQALYDMFFEEFMVEFDGDEEAAREAALLMRDTENSMAALKDLTDAQRYWFGICVEAFDEYDEADARMLSLDRIHNGMKLLPLTHVQQLQYNRGFQIIMAASDGNERLAHMMALDDIYTYAQADRDARRQREEDLIQRHAVRRAAEGAAQRNRRNGN